MASLTGSRRRDPSGLVRSWTVALLVSLTACSQPQPQPQPARQRVAAGHIITTGGGGAFLAPIYGDGRDGDLTCFDGSTTCSGLTPVGGVYTLDRWRFPRNMTVGASAVIVENGYGIAGTGTLTLSGNINDDGPATTTTIGGAARSQTWFGARLAGANASGGASSASGKMLWAPYGTASASASGGVVGGIGASGGPCQGGGGGGAVSTATGGAGGGVTLETPANGGSIAEALLVGRMGPTRSDQLTFGTGGGAGGSSGGAGGGGGGGGGEAWVAFPTIAGTGTITAKGGNAANAQASGGGGGGGGGGGIVDITFNTISSTITVSAAGGMHGTGAGGGGNGGDGGPCVVVCQNLSGNGTKATGCP